MAETVGNETEAQGHPQSSRWGSFTGFFAKRPVTTLAIAAGVGAIAGAELLAAGLAGGAAVLLAQRTRLFQRGRELMQRASEHIEEPPVAGPTNVG